jgi:hypothetical protein
LAAREMISPGQVLFSAKRVKVRSGFIRCPF